MPSSMRLRRRCRPAGGGLRPISRRLGVSVGKTRLLASIQSRYCVTKGPSALLTAGPVGQFGQGLHAQLDVRDPGRGDALDLGAGDPAGAGGAASALVRRSRRGSRCRGRRRTRRRRGIAGRRPARPTPRWSARGGWAGGSSGSARVDVQPGLEDEPLVALLVGQPGVAVVDQEDGDGARPVGDHALGDPQGLDRADRTGPRQAVAARDVVLDGLWRSRRGDPGSAPHAVGASRLQSQSGIRPPASPAGEALARRPPGRPGARPGNRPSGPRRGAAGPPWGRAGSGRSRRGRTPGGRPAARASASSSAAARRPRRSRSRRAPSRRSSGPRPPPGARGSRSGTSARGPGAGPRLPGRMPFSGPTRSSRRASTSWLRTSTGFKRPHSHPVVEPAASSRKPAGVATVQYAPVQETKQSPCGVLVQFLADHVLTTKRGGDDGRRRYSCRRAA